MTLFFFGDVNSCHHFIFYRPHSKHLKGCFFLFVAKSHTLPTYTNTHSHFIMMLEVMKMTAKEAKNLYQREWRKSNPDKVKAANERYWEKKANELMQKRQQG